MIPRIENDLQFEMKFSRCLDHGQFRFNMLPSPKAPWCRSWRSRAVLKYSARMTVGIPESRGKSQKSARCFRFRFRCRIRPLKTNPSESKIIENRKCSQWLAPATPKAFTRWWNISRRLASAPGTPGILPWDLWCSFDLGCGSSSPCTLQCGCTAWSRHLPFLLCKLRIGHIVHHFVVLALPVHVVVHCHPAWPEASLQLWSPDKMFHAGGSRKLAGEQHLLAIQRELKWHLFCKPPSKPSPKHPDILVWSSRPVKGS